MSAAPVVVDSRIVRATVFSDAAHVVRRARAALSPGLTRVALPDLPRHLDPARLGVATSAGRVRFVETDDLAWQEDAPEDTEAQARLAAASKRVFRLRGEHAALQAELQLVDSVVPGRGLEGSLGRLRPNVFLAGLEALTKRRRETLYAIRVAEYELALAEEELEVHRAQLDGAGRTERVGPRASIVVGVEAEAEAEAELDVTYTSGWATWRPYYTLRLGPNVEQVEIGRFADVWQETGEDWTEIALALSTAEPEERLVLPAVDPWILALRRSFDDDAKGLYAERARRAPAKKMKSSVAPPARASAPPPPQAMPAPAPMQAPGGAMEREEEVLDELFDAPTGSEMAVYASQFEEEGIYAEVSSVGLAAFDGGGSDEGTLDLEAPPPSNAFGGAPPPPRRPRPPPPQGRRPSPDHPDLPRLLEHAPPRAASGGIDFEMAVPGDRTCPSGRGHQRLGFGRETYDTEIRYLLRPGLRDHAFGQVTVTHSGDTPLLAGPAALFVEDAYFGTTRLLTTPAGGKLVLDLGAETAIQSARRSRTTVRTEGLINKEDVHLVEVTIEVESFKERPVKLEVQDQIPVSTDSEVKVRLLETSPRAERDDKSGVLTFHLTAPPRQRQTLTVRYEIEAPKDYQLVKSLQES